MKQLLQVLCLEFLLEQILQGEKVCSTFRYICIFTGVQPSCLIECKRQSRPIIRVAAQDKLKCFNWFTVFTLISGTAKSNCIGDHSALIKIIFLHIQVVLHVSKAVEQLLKKKEFVTINVNTTDNTEISYAVETPRGKHPLLQSKRSLPSLVPRPLPDFASQLWRKIGRSPGTSTMSRARNGGLGFVMMAMCPLHFPANTASDWILKLA